MARLEIPTLALGANTLDTAGTALVQADGGVITSMPPNSILRLANTSGATRTATIPGKMKSARDSDSASVPLGIGATRFLRLNGSRLAQADGSIQIDVSGTGVQAMLLVPSGPE